MEDCSVTLERLRELGFAEPVLEAVDALTKREDEHGEDAYLSFVRRAGRNDIARAVKLADIADNMDLSRIATPSERDLARVARYRKARTLLLRMNEEAEHETEESATFLRLTNAVTRILPAPDVLPLEANVSAGDIERRFPEHEDIVACDFYLSGAEHGTPVPGGFAIGRIINVDHHAPVPRMQRQVTSTALAVEHLREVDGSRRSSDARVIINHTDCDSILSSAMVAGYLVPDECFVAASIAADHTGDADPVADLLQGMDEARRGNRTVDQFLESIESLYLLLGGHRLPTGSQRALDHRLARRDAAARLVRDGRFRFEGPLAWAVLDEEVDAAFFVRHIPDAALIMVAQPREDVANRWNVKLRLGRAAPPGFTLHSLRIRTWNPAFGGRWNAGSNKRGGGTSIEPRDYANRLLARYMVLAVG